MKTRRVTEPAAAEEASDLTPAEIRGVLFALARRHIDERAARPAIAALNRIMRDSTDARRARERERSDLR
jgi:hypothetical protein